MKLLYFSFMKKIMIAGWLFVHSYAVFAQHGTNEKKINTIDSFLHSIYTGDKPGIAIAIMEGGKVSFKKGYGVAVVGSTEKITSATGFNIGSLTKQFTATAILQLAEEKKIALTDKLSRFFPGMNKKVSNSMTVQHLLTHSSGIIDHYGFTDTKNMRHAYNKDVFNAIKEIDSTYFIPGTGFRYSNTAYCLLALIIEKVSGRSYNTYLEEKIFQPLGMKQTAVWSQHLILKQIAQGYDFDSARNQFVRSGPDENIFFSTEGDGGIYSSVDDYLKWFNALQKGREISKKITASERSIQHIIDKEKRSGYGYGWFIDEHSGDKKVYHSGSNGGFRAYSFSIPRQNFLIVIFSNRSDIDLEKIVLKIIRLLRPEEQPFIPIILLTS